MEFEAPFTVFAYSTPFKPRSRLSVMFAPFFLPRVISIAGVPLKWMNSSFIEELNLFRRQGTHGVNKLLTINKVLWGEFFWRGFCDSLSCKRSFGYFISSNDISNRCHRCPAIQSTIRIEIFLDWSVGFGRFFLFQKVYHFHILWLEVTRVSRFLFCGQMIPSFAERFP